ncbi:hypothetical protein ACOMHN_031077 [Nucella lapillus]
MARWEWTLLSIHLLTGGCHGQVGVDPAINTPADWRASWPGGSGPCYQYTCLLVGVMARWQWTLLSIHLLTGGRHGQVAVDPAINTPADWRAPWPGGSGPCYHYTC